MIRTPLFALLLLLLVLPAVSSAAPPGLAGKVLRVYDGDTIKVEDVGKVRLLGIDTPEFENSTRDNYYLRQGINRGRLRQVADEALQYMIRTVKNRHVTLQTGQPSRDRHGRLLAYVYLPEGQLLNRLLIEKGLAAVYRKFDFQLKKEFLEAEAAARRAHIGLWK